ncbi:MAG: tRNA(His) guanylyltransferase Thg1 family protein [Eisenbergiella sp.]
MHFLKREDGRRCDPGENYEDFTKNFQKPYDTIFLASMKKALQYLCRSIPSRLAGYTSRFDMAVFFSAPDSFETPSWYNYDMSDRHLASSMASFAFNRIFEKAADSYVMSGNNFDETRKFTAMRLRLSIDAGALFTAKCFNIKKEQIADYLYLLQKIPSTPQSMRWAPVFPRR